MANDFKVGDILIGKAGVDYITQGGEYEVQYISRRGIASVLDNDGDDLDAYPCDFNLKVTVPPAKIRIVSLPGINEEGENIVHLAMDDAGLGIISQMIKDAKLSSDRAELRAQISDLEAQLKAL
jgi:hypothetical protein